MQQIGTHTAEDAATASKVLSQRNFNEVPFEKEIFVTRKTIRRIQKSTKIITKTHLKVWLKSAK